MKQMALPNVGGHDPVHRVEQKGEGRENLLSLCLTV